MNDSDIDPKIYKAAELLKAMAHPVRLRIIVLLNQQESLNVTTLRNILNLDQSLVSHHLIGMNKRGVLTNTRKGKEIYYALAEPTFSKALKLLLAIRLIG